MKYYKYLMIIFIPIIIINCQDLAQVRSEAFKRPIFFGQPQYVKYVILGGFSETYYTLGGSEADTRAEKICFSELKKYKGDAIINFNIAWRSDANEYPVCTQTCLYFPIYIGRLWIPVTVSGKVIKFIE